MPEEKREYIWRERLSNWLYYHVWHLAAVGLILVIAVSLICNKAELARQRCDHCIAYIGETLLPAECVDALKREIAALGTDVDGNGEVTVKINQYIVSTTSAVTEEAVYGRAAEIALLSDISEGESYFFLVQDPEAFQQDFQLMAHMDGSPSADDDFSVWDKVYAWADCPRLSALELGMCTLEDGSRIDCQQLLGRFWLGRRCYVTSGFDSDSQENAQLWALFTEGAELPGEK